MTIPCRQDMISASGLATIMDVQQSIEKQLLQILGQPSVKVQTSVYQCNITDKPQLLQILGQLSVKVWNKSKKAIDKNMCCQLTIDMLTYLNINRPTIKEIAEFLNHADITELRRKILNPLIDLGYVTMIYPDKPTSSKQRYTLTEMGKTLFE